MDLKKEIKLSDLFKRKPKEAKAVAETPAFEDSPAEGEPKRRLFSHGPKAPKPTFEDALGEGEPKRRLDRKSVV